MLEVMNKIIEMSVQAGFVICVILILRAIFLKLNVPRRLIYVLWAIPLFRLVCPVVIASSFSIVPWVQRTLGNTAGSWNFSILGFSGAGGNSSHVMSTWQKADDSLTGGVGTTTNGWNGITDSVEMPGTAAENSIISGQMVNPEVTDAGVLGSGLMRIESLLSGQFWQEVSLWMHDPNNAFFVAWIVGVVVLLGYSIIASVRLRKKLAGSVQVEQNCYHADHIKTPFVLGMIHPKIYIPSSLAEGNLEMIVEHEKVHIRRKDHVVKVLVFAVTCIYWFNPLVWVMYALFCRDMESAVDEKVIANFDQEERQTYAGLLLALHTDRRHLLSAPLAFGEGNVKRRIKNVVKYKKPMTMLVIVAVIVAAVVAMSLVTSTKYAVPENAEAVVEASAKGDYVKDGENFLSEEDVEELIHILQNTKLQWTFHISTAGIAEDFYDVWIECDDDICCLVVDSDTGYWQVDNRLYKVASPETIYMFLESVSPIETLHSDFVIPEDVFSKYDLEEQPVSIDVEAMQSRAYEETLEDIYQFGCDFVQYYVNSIVNMDSIPYFDKYIDYDTYMDLALYVELMQQNTVRQMVAGVAGMPYSKNIEFSEVIDVVELVAGTHRYKVVVEYNINGSNSAVHMLVRYQNGAPKIENICFDQKDSVDAIVIGSLNAHDITNFNKWLDTEWTAKVLDDMYAYGDKLMEIIQEKGIPYYSGNSDYYQDEDGMWVWNGNKYYYRLLLGGPNVTGDSAVRGSVYVVLSNDLNITYERARMASGISSSMADYFDPAYAKVVDWQHYDKQNPDMVPFTYNGEDPIMRAICNYMIAADYSTNTVHGDIQVPAPIILKVDDSDSSDIKVWGNFWSHTYKVEGQTLVSNGGGEWPCLMHLAKHEDQYIITRIDRVGDGSYYTDDLKEICKGQPGLYEQFKNTTGTDRTEREKIRQEFLRSYISYYAMDINSYQDYGWDKVYFE